ncbi:MAG: hypothetical protein R2717_06340 [Schumannella sp.]
MEAVPVLAICGSLRPDSLHRALLTAMQDRAPRIRLMGAELVRDLPLMDPALDRPDSLPSAVREFRMLAEACAGAVIASRSTCTHPPA